MTTSINTNTSAYYAQNNLRAAGLNAQASIARLSSGNRIIRASDDVSGLSIGTILRTDVNTLKTALLNSNQGATLLQVADGSLARIGEILQRQKALATQANSGAIGVVEKGYLDQEFQALISELDRIVDRTEFNGTKLLDGSIASDSTTLATERPAAVGNFVNALIDTSSTINTAVLTNGLTSLTVATVGTSDRALLAYQGSLADAHVSSVYSGGTSLGSLIIEINGVTFQTDFNDFDNTNTGANIVLTQVLTAAEATAGLTAMVLNLDHADLGESGDQAGMDDSAELIQAELRKIKIYQDRTLEDTAATDASAITSAKFAGTVLQGMDGTDFEIQGLDFDGSLGTSTTAIGYAPAITDFQITSNSSTNATFSVKINGVTYSSASTVGNETGVTVDGDVTDNDLDGTGAAQTGVLRLTSVDDSNAFIDIDLATNTGGANINVSSQAFADGLALALNDAFGSGANGGLAFQVGTESADTVSISIAGISSDNLYVDDDEAAVTMDLVTGDIEDISEALDNAIATVTSRRADVGALQSRFGYAAATLETSIQNLDAARGQFLDADISTESTDFAKNQVLIQASISVLAQANQLPQNLLKLIG